MKIAVVTPKISHFEVPLYRIIGSIESVNFKVFHLDAREGGFVDRDYNRVIQWGENLKSGYPNELCQDLKSLQLRLLNWEPNVVVFYGYYWKGAIGLLRHFRKRGIRVVHRGLLSPYYNVRKNWALTRLWRLVQPRLLKMFDGHHYGGDYSRNVLARAGVAPEDMFFVPYSVDSNKFARQRKDPRNQEISHSIRSSLGWSSSDLVLLFICQHTWFKAPDVMMRIGKVAQARFPHLKLLVVGSGKLTKSCQDYAENYLLPSSFHFAGFVPSLETVPYYLACDLVVFPSRYDTWSRAVNEAMLLERPCIVSHFVPAAGGLVDDGSNGYVVHGLKPEDYVEKIQDWINMDPSAKVRFAELAAEKAVKFSYEANTEELILSFSGRQRVEAKES